ncbi:hypothetical protein RUM44_006430 [Polyplax serrata]|uniref:C3H1-type domain-containing protein n=1 Tax=Polyplax serrata TaxID=468196 RepID=A0ABR1AI34_POLSC
MLPSRGFFKKNDCPFYESGSCERPHCHFRHRKKVVSENSTDTDTQDILISKDLAVAPLISSIISGIDGGSSDGTDNSVPSHSKSGEAKEEKSNQDSLFAKLVNQSNPYEKLNRHIPCAYTPTPQTRGVQPKNKSVSAKDSVDSLRILEILAKTANYSDHCSSVYNKESSSTYVPGKIRELYNVKLNLSNGLLSQQNNTNLLTGSLNSKNSEYKNSFFDSKESNSLSYEPQSTSKSVISDLSKNISEGSVADYVPSKVTIPESQYSPNPVDSSTPVNYVPSTDKTEAVQYVPEGSQSIPNLIKYTPSEKASCEESKYQPHSSDLVVDYIPTEKIKTTDKNEWNEFNFIKSEIEMMKALLAEETKCSDKDEIVTKTDTSDENDKNKENKEKNKEERRKRERSESRSRHHSSSRHRSKSSSHNSSSSKSKHSSSSSKHSSHRSSSNSSSRHHSSSSSKDRSVTNRKSSSSSSSHRSSTSHKRSEHHKRSREKNHEKKSHSDEEKKKRRSMSSDEMGTEGMSDAGNESDGKKRKNNWEDDGKNLKISKICDDSIELVDLEDDDPDTIEKECLEIFNSYTGPSDLNCEKKTNETTTAAEEYENSGVGRKRTAHSSNTMADHSVLRHKTARKLNNIRSAQEVMMERYKIVEKSKESSTSAPVIQQVAPILGLSRPSIRIAAVSNIQQMLKAKKAIDEKISQGLKVNERTTIAQTVAHGGTRTAHTPATKAASQKPTIREGSKQIPPVKRQIYLDKLLLETSQIYPTKEEAAAEALRLEDDIFRAHSGSMPAYHSAIVSALVKTRRRIAAVKGDSSSANSNRTKVSHYDILSGGKKNFSVIKSKKMDITMLSDRHIYEELLRCKLTPEELKVNSFPMEGKKPGYATCTLNFELKYNAHYLHIKKMTGNRRYCIRCSKQYEVHPVTLKQYKEGPETCCYHPGRKKSGGRNSERIYNCCNSSSTEGCATHVRHVTDSNDYDNLPYCVKTLSKDDDENPGVFALDCEMVYTRLGYELARVTVVNLKKEVVYDTLVKPKYPVECYNTFYSGIEEKMLEGVETTLKDVQAVLLSMFSDKTILIGHSLDSDLRALRLIHDTVVDTAVVYKNEKYHPYKYSLKDLCAKKISKIIQDNVGGHDSAEDATAALELMLNHVKEEVSKYDSLQSYEADRAR